MMSSLFQKKQTILLARWEMPCKGDVYALCVMVQSSHVRLSCVKIVVPILCAEVLDVLSAFLSSIYCAYADLNYGLGAPCRSGGRGPVPVSGDTGCLS